MLLDGLALISVVASEPYQGHVGHGIRKRILNLSSVHRLPCHLPPFLHLPNGSICNWPLPLGVSKRPRPRVILRGLRWAYAATS